MQKKQQGTPARDRSRACLGMGRLRDCVSYLRENACTNILWNHEKHVTIMQTNFNETSPHMKIDRLTSFDIFHQSIHGSAKSIDRGRLRNPFKHVVLLHELSYYCTCCYRVNHCCYGCPETIDHRGLIQCTQSSLAVGIPGPTRGLSLRIIASSHATV